MQAEDLPTLDDSGFLSASANPWALMCERDLKLLGDAEISEFFCQERINFFTLLNDTALQEELATFDVAWLRARTWTSTVPPAGSVAGQLLAGAAAAAAAPLAAEEVTFLCDLPLADDSKCPSCFKSRRGLLAHRRFHHMMQSNTWKCTVTNECVFCRTSFFSRQVAHTHNNNKQQQHEGSPRPGPPQAAEPRDQWSTSWANWAKCKQHGRSRPNCESGEGRSRGLEHPRVAEAEVPVHEHEVSVGDLKRHLRPRTDREHL